MTAPRSGRAVTSVLILFGWMLAGTAGASPVAAGGGTTHVVNSTGDASDDISSDGICDTGAPVLPLDPPECTLRAAIQQANFDDGLDYIEFEISGDGPHTIQPASPLPDITDPVLIDGYTEPGASANTAESGSNAVLKIEIDGGSAGAGATGLAVVGADLSVVTIRGLAISNFTGAGILVDAPGVSIEGNFIGTTVDGTADDGNDTQGIFVNAINATIGGGIAARNVISGNGAQGLVLELETFNHEIRGNLIGTNAAGTAALPNDQNGIDHRGENSSFRENVVSGNAADGIIVTEGGDNTFEGNFIGTNAAGTAEIPNAVVGLYVIDSEGNTIGGEGSDEANVISGNGDTGLRLQGQETRFNVITGNYIGTNADGAELGNGTHGIAAVSSGMNFIGGTSFFDANVIAHNLGSGVVVSFELLLSTRKQILGNSIYGNGGLGIDLDATDGDFLEADGVTPNDPDDTDTEAPNELQNFPVLDSATLTDDLLEISGSLNSVPNGEYLIEFFVSSGCDPSGHGEGETFVGREEISTDADGDATFDFVFDEWETAAGAVVTATATDQEANTSEFSACEAVVEAGPAPTSPTPSAPGGAGTESPRASRIPNTAGASGGPGSATALLTITAVVGIVSLFATVVGATRSRRPS